MAVVVLVLFIAVAVAISLLHMLAFRVELDYRRERDGESYFIRVGIPPLFTYTSDSAPEEPSGETSAITDILERLRRSAKPDLELNPAEEPQTAPIARLAEEASLLIRQLRAIRRILIYLSDGHFLIPEEAVGRLRWLRLGLEALARSRWYTDELTWVTRVGAGDPALTGMVTGLLWGSKVTAFRALSQRLVFPKSRPVIRVVPNFVAAEFATRFRCIVRVHVGNIIRAGLSTRAS